MRQEGLEINKSCFINYNSYITVDGKTIIRDHDHDYKSSKGIRYSSNIIGEIYIGNNVWIGAGSIVKGQVDAEYVFVQKRKSESIQYKEMVRQ